MKGSFGYGLGLAARGAALPLALGMRWAKIGFGRRSEEIPSPHWNVRLISKVVLDDLFLLSEIALTTFASLQSQSRLMEEMADAIAFYQAQGWLDDPAAFHLTPPPARTQSIEQMTAGFVDFQHLQFSSDYRPHIGEPGRNRWLRYRENRMAHAWLLEHPGPPRPWLVSIPGYRMGNPAVDFVGFRARWLYRELGLNIAVPVIPLHGPRKRGWRGGEGFLSGDFVDTVHAQAQAVWDVRRLIGWLRERDATSIGLYGISLGGYVASLVASLESDLKCVIAGIPATDFIKLAREHLPRFLIEMAERANFPFDDLEKLMRVVSPLAIAPRVPFNRRFLYAGLADGLASPSQALDLWKHWDCPELRWYEGSHISFLWEDRVKSLVRNALEISEMIALDPAQTETPPVANTAAASLRDS